MRFSDRILKHKVLSGVVIGAAAFCFGALVCGMVSIMAAAQWSGRAEAVSTTVEARVEQCDCLVRFFPAAQLPGSGTASDPFVVKNTKVDVKVGVNGVGLITIEDEDGNVLFTYNKTTEGYEEILAHVELQDEIGDHYLIAKLDGDDIKFNGSRAILYFRLEEVGDWIDVPSTGYFRVFGYMVDASGAVASGLMSAILFVGLFILFVVLKRREDERSKKKASTLRRRTIAQINPRTMKKSGIIRK
jgi:hypothetical protein